MLFLFTVYSHLQLPKSNVLSYRLLAPESLHAINLICALLIMKQEKDGPNPSRIGAVVFMGGEGTPPPPFFPVTVNTAVEVSIGF